MPHRSGYQCGVCGLRVHQALTVPVIEEHLQQDWPQLSIEAQQPEQPSPHKALPKKLTRIQVIRQLLEQQQAASPSQSSTGWKKPKGIFAVTNVAAVYTSESMRVLSRPLCPARAIRRPCKGAATSGSPPLPELFRKQAQQASQQPDTKADDNLCTQEANRQADQTAISRAPHTQATPTVSSTATASGGPTPRRLHFDSELDRSAFEAQPATSAQAMTPSHTAEPTPVMTTDTRSLQEEQNEEEMLETDEVLVDYF